MGGVRACVRLVLCQAFFQTLRNRSWTGFSVRTPSRLYRLAAATPSEAQDWVDAISRTIVLLSGHAADGDDEGDDDGGYELSASASTPSAPACPPLPPAPQGTVWWYHLHVISMARSRDDPGPAEIYLRFCTTVR